MVRKWKTLSSEYVLDEKWYRVRRDTVEVRPGHVVDDYFVGVFNDIVFIVAVTEDGKIPLVRQYKHGAKDIITEIPAGFIDDHEAPLKAAQRELREETGFVSDNWMHLGYFYKNPTKADGSDAHLYLARHSRRAYEQCLDDNEEIDVVMQSFEEVVARARRGLIRHVDTSFALMLAAEHLNHSV